VPLRLRLLLHVLLLLLLPALLSIHALQFAFLPSFLRVDSWAAEHWGGELG
jgi:hypothetical protein